MKDNAMSIVPATERTLRKLLGHEVVNIIDGCKQFPEAKIVRFKNPYRLTMIDMFIMENGVIYIGDVYGENMKREDMFYVKN